MHGWSMHRNQYDEKNFAARLRARRYRCGVHKAQKSGTVSVSHLGTFLPDRLMVGLLPLEQCILVRIQVWQQNIRSRFCCQKQYTGSVLGLGFEKPEQGSLVATREARLGWRACASDGEHMTRQESKSGSQFEIGSDFEVLRFYELWLTHLRSKS